MSLVFMLKVVLISSTGVLTPGPLMAAAAAAGVKKGWKGGFMLSLGHMVVELPLVILIGMGIATFIDGKYSVALSFVGGLFLLFFASLTAKDAISLESPSFSSPTSPLLAGMSLSALNPFFVAWWVGIGAPLVIEAIAYWGIAGIVLLYLAHVWMDFAWFTSLAKVTSLSAFSFSFRTMLLILAILVAIFGIDFIFYALTQKHVLPF
jgi:threonine/homoserine/homoserine lactone efflux protein